MATIVQPYNPWKEQLAAGIIAPIISGILERQRERDENRKHNALIAQSVADAAPPAQPSVMPFTGGNGWENAFHSNVSNPLVGFDTAMGVTTAPAQPTQAPVMPVSANDITRSLIANLGTKRFGGVNPEVAQKLIAPYLATAEQARNEFRQKAIADAVMNAPDAMQRLANVWNGAAQGLMPYDAITKAQAEIKPIETDTGGSIQRGIFDYSTGQFRNGEALAKTLTPDQAATNELQNKQLLESIRQFDVNDVFRNRQLDQQGTQFEATMAYNRETRDLQRQDANRPRYGAPFAVNGKLYQIDQNGENRPFMIGEEHVDAPENFAPSEWTEADTQMIKRYDEKMAGLKQEKQRLQDLQEMETDPHRKLEYNDRIAEVQEQIDAVNSEAAKYIASKTARKSSSSPNTDNPIHNIISNSNAGRITGKFGEPRYKNGKFHHSHGGVDLPGKEGEPIKVIPEMGEGLRVSRISNNPQHPSNFGCFVELQGTQNGKKIKMIFAHLKEGSIQVQQGQTVRANDILGGVGNTGHSHGNHVHVEVFVDGNKVDPEKFFTERGAAFAQATQTNAQPQPKTAPQATPKPQNRAQNVSAMWTHSSRKAISNQEYELMKQQMQAGKISWAHSLEELDRGLESIGYKCAGGSPVFVPSVLGWRPQFGSNEPQDVSEPKTAGSEEASVDEAVKKLNQDDSVGDYFTKWNVLPAGFAGIRGKK